MSSSWVVNTFAPWRKRVVAVLAQRGIESSDLATIQTALESSRDGARLEAMLERKRSEEPAMIAPFDAIVRIEGKHLCFELEDGTLSGWRYVCDLATLQVEPGARVSVGQQLNAGDVDDQLWIDVFGEAGVPKLREKLVSLTGLSERLADVVLAPMLDGVEVEHEDHSRRREPHRMTRARFEYELGARIGDDLRSRGLGEDPRFADLLSLDEPARARRYFEDARWQLSDDRPWTLPTGRWVLLAYRDLACMDEHGWVCAGPLLDIGTFVVSRRRLSVSDATFILRRPERDWGQIAQHKLGAREGRWNARVVTTRDRSRVLELRVWHETARPLFRPSQSDLKLEVLSGRVLVCDLGRTAWSAARDLSARCEQLVGAPSDEIAAMVDFLDVEGVTCATPEQTGLYRVMVRRDAEQRVEALAVRFVDDV
ncbi:MAG: hypothetical protein JNK05_32680 [Myxococcales bacterium]|nr:hypothetical protein [Myxococcales bacterium]